MSWCTGSEEQGMRLRWRLRNEAQGTLPRMVLRMRLQAEQRRVDACVSRVCWAVGLEPLAR